MDPKSETPLRRSRANQSVRDIQAPLINDDDAERRQSRIISEAMDSTPVTLVSEKEGLLGCLKIFSENKINKSNAWNMSLIDNFAALVGKHHKSMRDFQFIGTTLEASCKIYGLRVDSVHADVINMATGLCKFTINTDDNNDDGTAAADGDNADGLNTSQTPATNAASKATARKAKRKAGARCTIVKNTSTINAKLETYPLSEPTFAKLNTTIGDINSSKRLLNYVLSSADSELKHRSNLPFWDDSEHPVCEFRDDDVYAEEQATQVRLGGLGRMLADDLVLRQELRGYRITNAPAACDDDDDDDDAATAAHNASVQALPLDQSHIDLAFDINADIEPIAEPPAEFMDTGFDNDELEHMDADDMRAICAVRSLRRNVTALDDMRPVDSTSSQLEYSYRPLDNISRFWAGPSYWKIQKSRRTGASLGMAGGFGAAAADGSAMTAGSFMKRNQQQQQRRPAQRRKFEPIEFVDDEEFDDSMFISVHSAEAQKLRKINIYKRWDPKKLRLPTNLHLDRQRYDKYFYAPGLRVEWNKEPAHSVISQTAAYDYNNAEDREYCSNIRSDDEAAASPEPGGDDPHEVPTGVGDLDGGDGGGGANERTMVGVIGTEFAGRAPDKIERIDIPFARRAKVIDMKQLKRCCLSLIDRQRGQMSPGTQLPCSQMLNPVTNRMESLRYECGAATFTQTLTQLPQVLSSDQRAAVSTSTSFYSILHLANEQHLDLISIDAEDFFIRQLETRG